MQHNKAMANAIPRAIANAMTYRWHPEDTSTGTGTGTVSYTSANPVVVVVDSASNPSSVTRESIDLEEPKWRIQPIELMIANTFVKAHHRHAQPVVGHLFSLGLFDADWCLHGAAIIGRPVARALDDGSTVEVTRLVTYGTRNACSMLYGAAQREATRRGYQRVITYTRADETASSVKAANFRHAGTTTGRQWDTPSRPRKHRPAIARNRWEWTP